MTYSELETSMTDRIHLSPPDMTERERASLLAAFDSNWIAPAGPALNEFEARLRAVTATEDALAVTSGTAALHLGLLALGIGAGDVVVAPTLTFVASANAIRYVNAVPHFVDCDPHTGNMSPDALERALTDLYHAGVRVKAVMTVDLYGACANYREIEAICAYFGVPIIEDAAEAIGAHHNGRPAGSFGKLAAISFNGNKLVTTGGGGALVGDADLVARARHLAGQARDPELHFEHSEIGYAYRMSNLSAALGCAQLDRLDVMIQRTRAVHHRYLDALGHLPGIGVLDQDVEGRGNGWLTVITTQETLHPTPTELCRQLLVHNIEARPAWKPMHLQPLYRGFGITDGRVAAGHFAAGLCLPSGSSLSLADQTRVLDTLIGILRPKRRTLDLDTIDMADAPKVDLTLGRTRPHPERPASTR